MAVRGSDRQPTRGFSEGRRTVYRTPAGNQPDMTESLLDFYRRHGISPVRQDIRNLDVHFARRAALYRHLGLLPTFLLGRTILEIGPGSGFNSVYTASLGPSRY